jgi:lipopolysaccharide biosynthesis glycosyltransferase
MKFLIYIILISSSLNQYSLYIKNIYILNKEESYIDNNFQLFLDIISGEVIPNNLKINNMFDINLHSNNLNEQNIFITFKCDLYGPTNITDLHIKCILKDKIPENINGPFYFTKNHFDKSFQINYQNKNFNITLDTMNQPFYIGMIKSYPYNKGIFIRFNFIFKNPYNIIPIAMALNDNYIYPTIVSITSIIETSNKETKYNFYIIHPKEFKQSNLKKFNKMGKKYNQKCTINTINFEILSLNLTKARISRRIPIVAYYRIFLSSLLPFINKIIWLDSDTLIFKDLKEMYNIDMNNFYYKGFLDDPRQLYNITNDNDHYICSGVLLINLKKIRQDKIEKKYLSFINKNYTKLRKHDQTLINIIGYQNNGILPAKYGIFNIRNETLLLRQRIGSRKKKYSRKELITAYRNPTVLHCVKKVWYNKNNYGSNIWWKFATKNFFREICFNYFNVCTEIFGKDVLKKKKIIIKIKKKRKIKKYKKK